MKVRVQHPAFPTVVYEVPADDIHEWLDAGWLSLEPTQRPAHKSRRIQDPETLTE